MIKVLSICYDKIRGSLVTVAQFGPLVRHLKVIEDPSLIIFRNPTMHVYLKIKIKSLAEEAKLIRSEEQRILHKHKKWRSKAEARKGTVPPSAYFGLRSHRHWDVRREARAAHLAYGFLKGHPYASMEGATTRSNPDWKRIEALVTKYGVGDIRDRMQRFSAWKESS